MKVGIDAHFVGVRHGGNEYYFEHLIKALAALPPDGAGDIEYHAFSYGLKAAPRLPGVPLVPLRKGLVFAQRGLEIPRLARGLGLDVLHVPFNFLPVGRCAKVVSVHDLAFLHLPDAFEFLERQRMTLLTGISCRLADHVVTISEYSKADIVRAYRIPERKVSVTHLSVDKEAFRPWDGEAKRAFRARRKLDFPFLLHVGTLQPRKNILTLLKAFKSLVDSGDGDTHVALVGRKGWIYRDLFRYIEEHGLGARVHHYEGVGLEDLAGFYNTAEALVFPSVFEGFGIPILEAMHCGCPVISADVTSMPEVYGDAALAFSPLDVPALAEAMRSLRRDGSLRAGLVEKGFRNCGRFSWESAAEHIRKVYRAV